VGLQLEAASGPTDGRPIRQRLQIDLTDIGCGVEVSIGRVATGGTMEDMTFAVTFGNKPAPWATLASVPGVNVTAPHG